MNKNENNSDNGKSFNRANGETLPEKKTTPAVQVASLPTEDSEPKKPQNLPLSNSSELCLGPPTAENLDETLLDSDNENRMPQTPVRFHRFESFPDIASDTSRSFDSEKSALKPRPSVR